MKFRHVLSSGFVPVVFALSAFCTTPVVSAAPQLTVESERAAHPRIVEAIHHMRDALKLLEAAPDDFGGNKANAIRDAKVAIHSLKKALYYRLKMDDAAIDAAQE